MADEHTVSSDSKKQQASNKLNLSIDLRLIVIVLLLVIVCMLAAWRPWNSADSTAARTISVSGEATVKATPDEYVFYPSYQLKDADKATASSKATAKQQEVVAGLKKVGLSDTQIKADTAGYNSYFDETSNTYNYTVSITVTVDNKDLAQKVQDYLVSTTPDGQITPTGQFSKSLQNKLESQARDQATKDARAKAEQSAKNLGFSLGKVKSVDDSGFGGVGGCSGRGVLCPMMTTEGSAAPADSKAVTSIAVQPGQNELNYSVTVVYYVK